MEYVLSKCAFYIFSVDKVAKKKKTIQIKISLL